MASPISRLQSITLRGALVVFLFIAYFGLWGDTGRQAYIQKIAAPVLSFAVSFSDAPHNVNPRLAARALDVQHPEGTPLRHTAPAGFRFLLPAVFLFFFAPTKRYWLALWLGHVGLALLGLLFLIAGVLLHEAGFVVYRWSSAYLVDAFSLGIATLAVVREQGPGWVHDN